MQSTTEPFVQRRSTLFASAARSTFSCVATSTSTPAASFVRAQDGDQNVIEAPIHVAKIAVNEVRSTRQQRYLSASAIAARARCVSSDRALSGSENRASEVAIAQQRWRWSLRLLLLDEPRPRSNRAAQKTSPKLSAGSQHKARRSSSRHARHPHSRATSR